MSMVRLPTNTNLSIREHSVELLWGLPREAIVSFELFSYPADNGGQDCPVIILSKTVPYFPKEQPSSTPDYDRMVTQAARELVKDFERMVKALRNMAEQGESTG